MNVLDMIMYYQKINESYARSHDRERVISVLFGRKISILFSQYFSGLVAVFRYLFGKVLRIFEFMLVADTLNEILTVHVI